MTTDTPSDLVERLRSWAQNEEMIDTSFTEHGKVCNAAADLIEKLGAQEVRDLYLKDLGWRTMYDAEQPSDSVVVPSNESIEHAREYCEDDGIRLPSMHRDALVTMAREILRLAAAPTNAAPQMSDVKLSGVVSETAPEPAVAAPTDTPRTDALETQCERENMTRDAPWELARTLERDQRRIALDVIEAAANEADAWDYPELAKDIRAIDVDEIIGRKQ